MTDPILSARVAALRPNLERAEASVKLMNSPPLSDALPPDLRTTLESMVEDQVTWCRDELNQIDTTLGSAGTSPQALKDAWARYGDVQSSSRQFFTACLEAIGGIAFRRRGIDTGSGTGPVNGAREEEVIWQLADELLYDAARYCLGQEWHFLPVPSLDDALSDSLARTIRMRFPEWTIWSLPLLAHDFAHFAIRHKTHGRDDRYLLIDVLNEQTDRVVDLDAELAIQLQHIPPADTTRRDRLQRTSRRHHSDRLRVLLADSIGTWMMGPAYACAAVHLRLDPSDAYTGNPSPAERVAVMLGALEAMGRDNAVTFRAPIDALTTAWNEAVDRADPGGSSDDWRVSDAAGPLSGAFNEVIRKLPKMARYRESTWLRAMGWRSVLDAQHKAQMVNLTVEITESNRLRDALNALWLCRLLNPDMRTALDAAGPGICQEIVRMRHTQAPRSDAGKYGLGAP
jgi:hypothetical protein